MLTIDKLKAFGADVEDGLNRCMNNEAFYLKLVGKALEDRNYKVLENSIASNDLDTAFGAAHSLKGVLGNLALTPVYKPVYDITELLRSRTDTDYSHIMSEINEKMAELKALAE